MNAYTDLPGLEEIVLEESYVLAVRAEPATVVFEVDFVLTQKHPEYVRPPATERECFHRGFLRFLKVESLVWGDQGLQPAVDASGELDYGHIDSLTTGQRTFWLEGDWGRMEVCAGMLELELTPSERTID